MRDLVKTTLTSMEVAQMVGKEHYDLLKDIRRYSRQLGEGKISVSDFFMESTYVSEQNKAMPCFMVTKKGCEFIAHKLTGQKGTEFTARYINRFHEMEDGFQEKVYETKATSLGEVASYTKEMDRRMEKQGAEPWKICEAFKLVSEQFGIRLPDDFVKNPQYKQMTFDSMVESDTSCST